MNSSLKRTASLVRTQQHRRQFTLWRETYKPGSPRSTTNHSVDGAPSSYAPKRLLLRGFSTTESKTVVNTSVLSVAEFENGAMKTNISNNDCVTRRGPDDHIVTVIVGDKEFKTLKSTLQVSPVLSDLLQRAEEQQQLLQESSTSASTSSTKLFLDRDPKHFPVILQYLRNKVEDVSYNRECKSHQNHSSHNWLKAKKKSSQHTKYIRLDTKDADPSYLEDLYLEATYYELDELKVQLDHTTFVVRAFQFISGGSSSINPFERTKQVVATLRTTSLAVAGLGTGAVAFMSDAANSATTMAMSFLGS